MVFVCIHAIGNECHSDPQQTSIFCFFLSSFQNECVALSRMHNLV